MAALNQTLQTHLPTVAYQAILDQFGEDPSDLFREEGVNYEYNGKIWNIKIGFQRNSAEKVIWLFIRTYSTTAITGDRFIKLQSSNGSDLIVHHERTNSSYKDGYVLIDDISENSEMINTHFIAILNTNKRMDGVENPQFLKKLTSSTAHFFATCPKLFPFHQKKDKDLQCIQQ